MKVAVIADKKASGTPGGTLTAGAWQIRDLNNELFDPDGLVSLNGNVFSLVKGIYLLRASSPAYAVEFHQIRLYDTSHSVVIVSGSSEYAKNLYNVQTRSVLAAYLNLDGLTGFRLEHRCSATIATYGCGQPNNFGGDEIYSLVEIEQIG